MSGGHYCGHVHSRQCPSDIALDIEEFGCYVRWTLLWTCGQLAMSGGHYSGHVDSLLCPVAMHYSGHVDSLLCPVDITPDIEEFACYVRWT